MTADMAWAVAPRLPAALAGFAAADGCDVFALALDAEPTTHAWAILSDDEQQRAQRFRSAGDRWTFVHTRCALRQLLGQRLGVASEDVRFDVVGRGKPVLAQRWASTGLRFSVAHTAGLAVIALSNGEVGVDIERVAPESWDRDMAALVLSPAELEWVDAQADIHTAFFTCWTRKEAWVKMGDLGIDDGLAVITLTPTPAAAIAAEIHSGSPWPDIIVACATGCS
ncbi:unannotated protein [freshwater metagenome]|uniref:Unannotated protein n=1 Tax=freshwater metagenome TaxID=449393 RepID=A0A6J7D2I0_9ZZZZ|nr:4'-phosphopantetheinyl transferase superfamily protein [Actinomycetota bacterium]